ncbi:MAG TPA: 2OG-Fe(II) oxygenase [Oleiagrimonas sp.]|nr:2OG-Fe(II) oxygenase [Oleiagrimonas sp.]
MNSTLLDTTQFDRPDTLVFNQPFSFMVAHAMLPHSQRQVLGKDFPRYNEAGFFPYDEHECGESVRALVDRLTAPEFADAVGKRLGIEHLGGYPTLVTMCRSLNRRHGTIHTDSKSKVATALLYLNDNWPDTSDGCLRFLRSIDDIDATVSPEIKPLYGEFVAFKRADNSFHGHLPYEGERRVIQVAWLVSEEAKLRKTQRGRFSRMLKKLFGSLDQKVGAGRDRNASHR